MDQPDAVSNTLIGCLYLLTPLLVLAVYIPCIIVLFTDADFKDMSCLRIMGHMGLTDLINLIGYMICGFWQLTAPIFEPPYWVNRILTTYTIVTGWWNYIFLANLLGLNRCFARVKPALELKIFSPKATTAWLSLVWLNTAAWLVLFSTPKAGILYFPQMFSFYYDMSTEWIGGVIWASFFHCVFHTALTTLWYGIIVVATVFEVHGLASISPDLRSRERNLLLQSVTICIVLAVTDQYYHNGWKLALPFLGKYTFVVANLLFICAAGCNPFVYLTFNKTLRMKVKEFVFGKKQGQVAPAPPTQGNTTKRNAEENNLVKVETS